MLEEIDLHELAEMEGPTRAFVSFYGAGMAALQSFDDRAEAVLALLEDEPDEREHCERSLEMLREVVEKIGTSGEGVAAFACWALDFAKAWPLSVPVPTHLHVGPSPFLRPLAELQEENERYVVVIADNDRARIEHVISAEPREAARVRGDVKNKTKKGGWSQGRYQRRRRSEIVHYVKEISDAVESIVAGHPGEHVVLLGSEEVLVALEEQMPQHVAERIAGRKGVDVDDSNARLMEIAAEIQQEQEREDEADLWGRIREEAYRGGMAATGPRDVLDAAREARIDTLCVERDAKIDGVKCRECEWMAAGSPTACPQCRSDSVFGVDLVNEVVDRVERTGGSVDFVDPIPGLTKAGRIAALVRWSPPSMVTEHAALAPRSGAEA